MKKRLLFLSVLLFIFFGHAQKTDQQPLTKVDSMLVHIDKKTLTTGILYQRVSPWASLDVFNESKENTSNTGHFEQALHELYKASNKKKFVYYRELRKKYTPVKHQNVVDVGIINATFQSLNYNENNEEQGGLRLVNNNFQPITGKVPFVMQQVLIASPLKKYVVGQDIVFNVDPTFFFQEATDKKITNLTVDFGAKQKYTLISNGRLKPQKIPIRYSETGKKTIVFSALFNDGTSLSTKANINVKVSALSNLKTATDPLVESLKKVSTIPFQGYDESSPIYGEVDYRIFYHKNNGNTQKKLLKPIVIIDGFDPLDQRKIQDSDPHDKLTDDEHVSIEEMMTYFNNFGEKKSIIDKLRDLGNGDGYDVIIVNHPVYTRAINGVQTQIDGGADYIERNAMNHVTLYQHLNSVLAQNGSTEQLVIVGPSMGGQISRYALAYMEKHNIPHNTRLWVSVDSPHLGANIPLGVQSLINMIASTGNAKAEEFVEDWLGSPAAKQQLIEQYSESNGYNLDGRTVSQGYSQTKGHPFYINYYNNLFGNGIANSKGYPQNPRKVSLVNGSLLGSKAFKNPYKINHYDFNDNNALRDDNFANGKERVLDIVGIINILGIKIVGTRLHAYFVPDLGYGTIAHFYRKKSPYYNQTRSITNANIRGNMDNVSGGWFPTQQILAKSIMENLPSELSWFELRVLKHTSSFISTVSALGFKNPNFNWGQKLDRNLLCNNEIPFDSYFGPKINERHTSFTEESVNWLLKELDGNEQDPHFPLSSISLTTLGQICNLTTLTYNSCDVPGAVQTWTTSSNLQVMSSNDYSVTVDLASTYARGGGWIKSTFNNGQAIQKDVWVGKPSFPQLITNSGVPYNEFDLPAGCANGNTYWKFKMSDPLDKSTELQFSVQGGVPITKNVNNGEVTITAQELGMLEGMTLDVKVRPINTCGSNFLVPVYKLYRPTNCECGIGINCNLNRIASDEDKYTIFPNPTNDHINIVSSTSEIQIDKKLNAIAKLYDMMANEKKSAIIKNNKGYMNVANLPLGLYILKIYTDEKIENHMIAID